MRVALLTCALGPDAAGTLLSARLLQAREHIDAAVYEISVYYAHLLRRRSDPRPSVRLLLDDHTGANAGSAALFATTDSCRVLRGHFGAEAHWKMLHIDDCVAVGTGNLLHRDAPRDPQGLVPPADAHAGPGTREWWAFVDGSRALNTAAAEAFDARWAVGQAPPPSWRSGPAPHIPPVGTPLPLIPPLGIEVRDDALGLTLGGAAAARLLAERLGVAARRVLVTVPYVHARAPVVDRLITLLGDASRRGADVRLLIGGDGDSTDLDASVMAGIPVRTMDPLRSTTGHAKGVVADDAACVMSSNWSAAGLGGNLEAALTVDDPRAAGYFAAAFEHDWETARPVTGAG